MLVLWALLFMFGHPPSGWGPALYHRSQDTELSGLARRRQGRGVPGAPLRECSVPPGAEEPMALAPELEMAAQLYESCLQPYKPPSEGDSTTEKRGTPFSSEPVVLFKTSAFSPGSSLVLPLRWSRPAGSAGSTPAPALSAPPPPSAALRHGLSSVNHFPGL